LYPRAWRERYGEEFLASMGPGSLHVSHVIDIVSGAIDTWLSADVRRAPTASRVAPNGGGPMLLKSLMVCERRPARVTTRSALIDAGVMIGATFLLTTAGLITERVGWPATAGVLMDLSFLGALTFSMPFWPMKGQPTR
jgi:hypothetical protein